jgi:hypothetical protein
MDITVPPGFAADGRVAADGRAGLLTNDARSTTAARLGAWVVLLGTMMTTVGLSWDIQWHTEVGPDTFFTLPHLFLYSGSGIAGIASLVMVLISTSAQRAGQLTPRWVGGTSIRVFGGTFTAPFGYLVSGVGAALFLLYGLLDLWWHSIYGFDAVLDTPSHIALFLSMSITMAGSIMIFAAARHQRWGRLGIVLAIPILIILAPVTTQAFTHLTLPVDPTIVGTIFFSSLLLITGAGILRRPGGAIAIAAALGILQAFLWWFSPWAAARYAASVGLPLRDGLTPQPPVLSSTIPMFLFVAAAIIEGVFWMVHTRHLDARKFVPLLGGVTGLILAITIPLQQVLTDPTAIFDAATVAKLGVAGILFGALAGFLAGRFITMLRALAPARRDF